MTAPYRVGVVGFSGNKFDAFEAANILYDAFREIDVRHSDCMLVTGYTDLGIPGIAYRTAEKFGWILKGIACKKAEDHPCYDCHDVVIVGEDWGDESETFLSSIDMLIKVGGGPQSIAEFAAFTGPKEEFDLKWLE